MTAPQPPADETPPGLIGVQLLTGVDTFEGLDPAAIAELAEGCTWRRVAAGSILFEQGADATSMYIVVTGRLRAIKNGAPIGDIGPGEAVGELALLTDEGRSATVRCVRDCLLVELTATTARRVLFAHQGSLMILTAHAARRSVRVQHSGPSAAELVVVVDASSDDRGQRLVERLRPADARSESLQLRTLTGAIDHDTRMGSALQADLLLIVRGPQQALPEWVVAMITYLARLDGVGPHIVVTVVHEGADLRMPTPGRWDAATTDEPTHLEVIHVDPDPQSVRRLVRRLSGTRLGIAFSGGGGRAMAHLGVMEVLLDAGLEPDMFAGTSMGGLVAAQLGHEAATLDGAAVRAVTQRLSEELRQLRLTRRFTVPSLSIWSVRHTIGMYQRLFDAKDLRDAWIPVTLVTTDIGAAAPHFASVGSTARWARATATAPGGWPAVVDEHGHLHVDGAIFDNLPVEPLFRAGAAKVLAIDVSRSALLVVPPGTAERNSIVDHLRHRADSVHYPTMAPVLAASTLSAGRAQREIALALAAATISPDVASIGLTDYRRSAEAVEAGRHAAAAFVDGGGLAALTGQR